MVCADKLVCFVISQLKKCICCMFLHRGGARVSGEYDYIIATFQVQEG